MNGSIVQQGEQGDLFTTSEQIAEGAGVQHKNVLESITKYQADFERFGLVAFQTRPRVEGQHGGGDVRVAVLNEHQATLLLTYAKNTEQVRDFKVRLVEEFFRMAQQLRQEPPQLPATERMAQAVLEAQSIIEAKDRQIAAAQPAVDYMDRYVSNDDAITVRTWAAQFGLTEPEARALLVEHKIVYRKPIGSRWSNSKGRIEKVEEWHAYARHLHLFDLRPQHNAPRHHNGQVRTTLYVRQAQALELAARVGIRYQVQQLEVTA